MSLMSPAAFSSKSKASPSCDAAVTDTVTYELPAYAEPGTYLVTVKGRSVFMGEDVPASRLVRVRIGPVTDRAQAIALCAAAAGAGLDCLPVPPRA